MTSKFVDIRQARTSLEVQEDQTILDAALAVGIPYPHGCRSGRCGSCKSRLIEGEVELLQHSRFALTEEEKADVAGSDSARFACASSLASSDLAAMMSGWASVYLFCSAIILLFVSLIRAGREPTGGSARSPRDKGAGLSIW